jgi:hypothetical protein
VDWAAIDCRGAAPLDQELRSPFDPELACEISVDGVVLADIVGDRALDAIVAVRYPYEHRSCEQCEPQIEEFEDYVVLSGSPPHTLFRLSDQQQGGPAYPSDERLRFELGRGLVVEVTDCFDCGCDVDEYALDLRSGGERRDPRRIVDVGECDAP